MTLTFNIRGVSTSCPPTRPFRSGKQYKCSMHHAKWLSSLFTTEPFPGLCEHSVTELLWKLQQEDDTMSMVLNAVKTSRAYLPAWLKRRVGNFIYYSNSKSNCMLMKDFCSAIIKTAREGNNGLSWCFQNSWRLKFWIICTMELLVVIWEIRRHQIKITLLLLMKTISFYDYTVQKINFIMVSSQH